MSRENFLLGTKRIIAEHAGLRCSYLSCNRITTGPVKKGSETSNTGVAAHIYSASSGGPRGQGGLSKDELKQGTAGSGLTFDIIS